MKYYLLCLLVSLSLVGTTHAKSKFMEVDAKFGNCKIHHKYDEKSAKLGAVQNLSLSCRSGDARVSLVCSDTLKQVYVSIKNKYFEYKSEGTTTVSYLFDKGRTNVEEWQSLGSVLLGSYPVTFENTYENFLSGLETAEWLFFRSKGHEGKIQLEGARVAVHAFKQLCKDKY